MHTQAHDVPAEATIRTAIVDGEASGRKRIRELLEPERDVRVVGEYRDVRGAASGIPLAQPDLLFLNVRVSDGSALSVLEKLRPHVPPTVLVTDQEGDLARPFGVHAVDYLLKPFDVARFRRSLERARGFLAGNRAAEEPVRLSRLAVKGRDRIFVVHIDDVDWIDAAGNYVRLHVGGKVHHVRETLNHFETKLDPGRFVRVHRSAIVNIDRVIHLEPAFQREHVVTLQDGTRLRLSATYRIGLEALVGRF